MATIQWNLTIILTSKRLDNSKSLKLVDMWVDLFLENLYFNQGLQEAFSTHQAIWPSKNFQEAQDVAESLLLSSSKKCWAESWKNIDKEYICLILAWYHTWLGCQSWKFGCSKLVYNTMTVCILDQIFSCNLALLKLKWELGNSFADKFNATRNG